MGILLLLLMGMVLRVLCIRIYWKHKGAPLRLTEPPLLQTHILLPSLSPSSPSSSPSNLSQKPPIRLGVLELVGLSVAKAYLSATTKPWRHGLYPTWPEFPLAPS